jgi:hypothetical protein
MLFRIFAWAQTNDSSPLLHELLSFEWSLFERCDIVGVLAQMGLPLDSRTVEVYRKLFMDDWTKLIDHHIECRIMTLRGPMFDSLEVMRLACSMVQRYPELASCLDAMINRVETDKWVSPADRVKMLIRLWTTDYRPVAERWVDKLLAEDDLHAKLDAAEVLNACGLTERANEVAQHCIELGGYEDQKVKAHIEHVLNVKGRRARKDTFPSYRR